MSAQLALVCAAVVWAAQLCTAQLPEAASAPLAAAIAQSRAIVLKEIAPKVPGLSVAVAVDGRVV